MIKLKNVSKFYYTKGIVASGFSKINLELNLGEFVVITGESGSGKSTLLNVISGLDSYEEGEMYINGEETSHYTENDFEIYRKKYIGNIFQSFNLINSYTVYQNIEIVLLINGYKKKEIKEKIINIIKQVDLLKYKNVKVSKLSGGQKQRVAIARALAKDTPIIVADEPTGNLDTKSAVSVLKILSAVSKNKLVVVVTHNFEQIEEYATRKIKMHDGKIVEDKVLKDYTEVTDLKEAIFKDITFLNKIKLGLRNTFNVVPKFLLLMLVYLFVTLAVTAEYSSLKKQEYENSKAGFNTFFNNISDKRIVIKKANKSFFTEDDFKNISLLDNVEKIVKDDLLLDNSVSLESEDLYSGGYVKEISEFEGPVDEGRLPENENEIIIETLKENFYFMGGELENTFTAKFNLYNNYDEYSLISNDIKVVGVKYFENSNIFTYVESNIYVSPSILSKIRRSTNQNYSKVISTINEETNTSQPMSNIYQIKPSSKVISGNIIISSDMNMLCKKYSCKNTNMNIKIENLYWTKELDLKVSNTYEKKDFNKLTGYSDYDIYNGAYFINEEDYYDIFEKEFYQSSVFISDTTKVNNTIDELKSLGLTTLYIKNTIVNPYESILIFSSIFTTGFIVCVTIGLFFIAYFIIKIILKSRNIYYSTIRILGANKKTANNLLDIELFTVFNLSFFTIIGLIILISKNIIKFTYAENLIKYLNIKDYIALYGILFIISFLITKKYSKSLFKASAMKSYREEV